MEDVGHGKTRLLISIGCKHFWLGLMAHRIEKKKTPLGPLQEVDLGAAIPMVGR